MFSAMFSRVLVTLCVLFGLLAPAHGQRHRGGRGMKPEMEPFAADGTIEAVAPGRIQILTRSNQRWMIFVDPKALIHVTGTAEADFLRPGLFVQFTAEFDRQGRAKEKIKQLTLFTPTPQVGIGFWPEGAGPAIGAEGGAANAGGRFGGGVDGRFGDGSPPSSNIYAVHGQLRGNRKGKWTVHAGRGMFQIELAEDPQIHVDLADYSVAGPGDKISITRGRMFAGRMGVAQAHQLTIELSQPLTIPKRKPRRPIPRRTPRRPKKEGPRREPFEVQEPKKPQTDS